MTDYLVISPTTAQWVDANVARRGFVPPHAVFLHDDERLYVPPGTWDGEGATAWSSDVMNMVFIPLADDEETYTVRMVLASDRNGSAFLFGRLALELPISALRAAHARDPGCVSTAAGAISIQSSRNKEWINTGELTLTFAVRSEHEVAPLIAARAAAAAAHPSAPATPNRRFNSSSNVGSPALASNVSTSKSPTAAPSTAIGDTAADTVRGTAAHSSSSPRPADPPLYDSPADGGAAAAAAVLRELRALRSELAAKDALIRDVQAQLDVTNGTVGGKGGSGLDLGNILGPIPTAGLTHMSDFEQRIGALQEQEASLRAALACADERREELAAASQLPLQQRARLAEAMELHRVALKRLEEAATTTQRVFAGQVAADQQQSLGFRDFADRFAREVAGEVTQQVIQSVEASMRAGEGGGVSDVHPGLRFHGTTSRLPEIESGKGGRGSVVAQGGV